MLDRLGLHTWDRWVSLQGRMVAGLGSPAPAGVWARARRLLQIALPLMRIPLGNLSEGMVSEFPLSCNRGSFFSGHLRTALHSWDQGPSTRQPKTSCGLHDSEVSARSSCRQQRHASSQTCLNQQPLGVAGTCHFFLGNFPRVNVITSL